MINVCSQCLRLNSLGKKKCVYCQSNCAEIESSAYGQFCLSKLKKEGNQKQSMEDDYPDLKIFEECRNMDNHPEMIFARP